jgi:hypothetical protein
MLDICREEEEAGQATYLAIRSQVKAKKTKRKKASWACRVVSCAAVSFK